MDLFQTVCQVCTSGGAANVTVVLAVVWPVLSALALLVLKSNAIEAKIKNNPQLSGLLKVLDGLGLDPKRIRDGLVQVFSSKTPPVIKPPTPPQT